MVARRKKHFGFFFWRFFLLLKSLHRGGLVIFYARGDCGISAGSLSASVSFCLSQSLSISLCLILSFSLFLSVSLSIYLSFSVPIFADRKPEFIVYGRSLFLYIHATGDCEMSARCTKSPNNTGRWCHRACSTVRRVYEVPWPSVSSCLRLCDTHVWGTSDSHVMPRGLHWAH